MPNVDPQQILEAALPFVAYLVSYLIQKQHWSASVNTAIASSTIVLAGLGTVFIQHRLTPNILADFLLIASVSAGLQTGALAPLSKWLKDVGSTPTGATPSVRRASRSDEY